MIVNDFILATKKMIQIIACRYTKSKFREVGTTIYSQNKNYEYIKEVFVVPCPRHPLFKERFLNTSVNITCKCLESTKGCCSNFKTRCFTLNFLADKIKVASVLDVPSDVQLKKIDDYLKSDIKSMPTSFPAHLFAIRGKRKRGPGTLQTHD